MVNRFQSILMLGITGILMTSCNLPQLSQDAGIEVEEDVVACSYEALVEMFVEHSEVTLSPGCVYEIPRAVFYEGGMSDCSAGLPIIGWSGYIIHGNGATLRRSPDPDNEPYQNDFRFFYINHNGSLEIEDLTLENGNIPGGDTPCTRGGGAIISNGPLTVRNSRFIGNNAQAGGAISIRHLGSLHVEGSTFEGNSASMGGAINLGDTDAQISDSIFRYNQASYGGAIRNLGSIELRNSQFDSNSVDGRGGAIQNEGALIITGSSFSSNSAAYGGGGIYSEGGLTIENTTISGNHRGGIVAGFSSSISHSTIVNNVNGPGIHLTSNPSVFRNNIIAFNHPDDCDGTNVDTGGSGNLDTDGTCPGTMLTVDPNLGPLTNNGGATLTHALLMGSPAVDAAIGACPDYDQRGIPRPEGASCDLGAFEWGEIGLGDFSFNAGEMLFSDPSEIPGDVLHPESEDEPATNIHTGRIDQAVLCFAGPGPVYGVVSSLQPGALVEIVGISENGDYIVIFNPCYPGVPCWTSEGSIELQDELDPSRVIPDPALPEEGEEEVSKPTCTGFETTEPQCKAAEGTWTEGGAGADTGTCTCPS